MLIFFTHVSSTAVCALIQPLALLFKQEEVPAICVKISNSISNVFVFNNKEPVSFSFSQVLDETIDFTYYGRDRDIEEILSV